MTSVITPPLPVAVLVVLAANWFAFVATGTSGVTRLAYCVLGIAILASARFLARHGGSSWLQPLSIPPGSRVTIVLASGLALYFELLLIRYQASILPVFGFFKNITLLSAFLGLGIGYAKDHLKLNFLPITPLAILLQVVVLYWADLAMPPILNPVLEQKTMGLASVETFGQIIYALSFIGFMSVSTTLACFPLGHFAALTMRDMPAVPAYGWNLIGSLLGALAFTVLSALGTPPAVWLAFAFGLILWFQRKSSSVAVLSSLACLSVLAIEGYNPDGVWGQRLRLYSPYQLISVVFDSHQKPEGVSIQLHHTAFQKMHDLRPEGQSPSPNWQKAAYYYNLPYTLKPSPPRVLIVGAGSGNDVAAAIRGKAAHVDAVEIDPLVAWLGGYYHPEQPYQNPAVHLHIDDARHFIRNSQDKYDLIVYGLLDSHTANGSLSNLRLDSFVYTSEALRQARALLKPDGLMVLSFSLVSSEQGGKFYRMLSDAFDGLTPRCLPNEYCGFTFIAGAGVSSIQIEKDATQFMAESSSGVLPSTDNWPFVYVAQPQFPQSYSLMIGWLLVLTFVSVKSLNFGDKLKIDWQFFWLGAGFMLIETKELTELGLDFGNTWYLIPIVISTVLIMGFLANVLAQRVSRVSVGVAYFGLLLLVSLEAFFWISSQTSGVLRLVTQMSPLFFSALVFSLTLKQRKSVNQALSSNLLGAMCGGLAEYFSISLGFHGLAWLSLGIYTLAALLYLRSRI